MGGVINGLIDGLFAFAIVGLFVWFVIAKIRKQPMFELIGVKKPNISKPQKLTSETWKTSRLRM